MSPSLQHRRKQLGPLRIKTHLVFADERQVRAPWEERSRGRRPLAPM